MRTLIRTSGFPKPVHLSEGRIVLLSERNGKWLDGKFGVNAPSEEVNVFRTG
jgi:hypothetical protein